MTNEQLVTGETFGEDKDGPRAFLLDESAKPFAELRAALDDARQRLLAAFDGVTQTQSQFAPGGEGEDAWSIDQIARHLVRTESWIETRIAAIGRGDDAQRFESDAGRVDKPFTDSLQELEGTRAALVATVDALDSHEDADKTARHPFFGELNCRGWFRLVGLHEADHARQVERIKALTTYPRT